MIRLGTQKLGAIDEICRVRPRKNFLAVLNRASMVRRLQKESKILQAIEQTPRPPKCIETMPDPERLTKYRPGIK